jgi:hypothetical protein
MDYKILSYVTNPVIVHVVPTERFWNLLNLIVVHTVVFVVEFRRKRFTELA